MMTLYAAAAPNGRRALFVMEELALPYTLRLVDLAHREQDEPWFRALNPLGHVPVLVDPDGPGGEPITLTQSGAIILYLARKAGRLMPQQQTDRLEAEQLTWMILSDLAAASTVLFLGQRFEAAQGLVDVFRTRLDAFLGSLEARLATRPFLCSELSVADFALLPLVLLPHVTGRIEHPAFNSIKRWKADMLERDSVIRALSKSAHH